MLLLVLRETNIQKILKGSILCYNYIIKVIVYVVSIVFDSQTIGAFPCQYKEKRGLAKRDEVLIAYHSASNLLSLATETTLVSFTLGPGHQTVATV